MALNTFTFLCNHHHYPFLEPFLKSCTTETLYPLNNNSPVFPSPTPSNHHSTFISVNLTTVGTACKWNHTVFTFLWLAYFTSYNVFKIHPCCSMCQNVLPSKIWIIFHCMYMPHCLSVHLSVETWVASTLWLLWKMIL